MEHTLLVSSAMPLKSIRIANRDFDFHMSNEIDTTSPASCASISSSDENDAQLARVDREGFSEYTDRARKRIR